MKAMVQNKVARFLWPTVYIDSIHMLDDIDQITAKPAQ